MSVFKMLNSQKFNIIICSLAGSYFAYKMWKKYTRLHIVYGRKAVVITGCDSGLGFSFAKYCMQKRIIVLACVLNLNSSGAQELASGPPGRIHMFKLDLMDEQVIQNVSEQLNHTINENEYDLIGVVNNAGILVFGEFEYLLPDQITQQIQVNFLGPIKFTKVLLPLIREHRARIINVTSHCSKIPLPSLSIYSATKAALDAWSTSLRIELEKFGVKVITFTPGSYFSKSRIMSRQCEFMSEMERHMSSNVKEAYSHFPLLRSYLNQIGAPSQDTIGFINDPILFSKFHDALLSINPQRSYINEPFRYKMYNWLFKLSLTEGMKEYFVKKFTALPIY